MNDTLEKYDMTFFPTPHGMNRRHFLSHLAGSSAMAISALSLTRSMTAQAATLNKNHKSCILLWMGGGPPTIDIWDMKPGQATGGQFKPISTTGEGQITELLPKVAQQMHHLSIVRSMSTREADHERGRYYMHTGFVPNPNVEHPSYGSVIAHELENDLRDLEIPPFVSIDGGTQGPGFLGMAYAPFQVNSNGQVRNAKANIPDARWKDRLQLLGMLEKRFERENRGPAAGEHAKVLEGTVSLLTSKQLEAFKVRSEPEKMLASYGDSGFGRGCLMARRLVETGVPFVEVNLGGWDLHQNCFEGQQRKLPEVDQAMSALVEDLATRGMLDNTVVLWMGEFGRTPRINAEAGRDHWARSWSMVIGGGGIVGGKVIGATGADGTRVTTEPYSSEDLMSTVCQAMGISLNKIFTASNGRPMKIAGGGKVIGELFV